MEMPGLISQTCLGRHLVLCIKKFIFRKINQNKLFLTIGPYGERTEKMTPSSISSVFQIKLLNPFPAPCICPFTVVENIGRKFLSLEMGGG